MGQPYYVRALPRAPYLQRKKLIASGDAITRNLPNLLSLIVILAFLLSWLLVTTGPRISSAKINEWWMRSEQTKS